MKTAPRNTTDPETPARQLAAFIAKFDPEIARILRSCRAAMRKRFPTAFELVHDNYDDLSIEYCTTPRASDCIVSLTTRPGGVALTFQHGATLLDPHDLLLGSDKQKRYLPLTSAAMLAQPRIAALLQAAAAQAKTPLPECGRRPTVIQSVSARQKPRSASAPAGNKPPDG